MDLSFPLPKLPLNYIRGHAFFNSGTSLKIDASNIMKTGSDLISSFPSTAIGLGLIARFAGFRLELNYCLPVYAATTDMPKTGFQLGIGINFM
jgi:outer membrane protein insertion porin family